MAKVVLPMPAIPSIAQMATRGDSLPGLSIFATCDSSGSRPANVGRSAGNCAGVTGGGGAPDTELIGATWVSGGGPHAIPWTHTDEVNAALLRFLGHPAA